MGRGCCLLGGWVGRGSCLLLGGWVEGVVCPCPPSGAAIITSTCITTAVTFDQSSSLKSAYFLFHPLILLRDFSGSSPRG